jgi:putative transcriptional regulator
LQRFQVGHAVCTRDGIGQNLFFVPLSMSRSRFEPSDSDFNREKFADVGSYLIASPLLDESPFRRSVVFVLQDTEEGTFGIVLNRPGDSGMKNAWKQMTGSTLSEGCIVQGGPLGGPVLAIHRDRSLAEYEVPGGIYVSSQAEKLSELLKLDESALRIVFGIAAWKCGQLSDEINRGLWYQMDAPPGHVFDDATFMWEEFLRRYGQTTLSRVVGIRRFPPDPSCN